MNEVNLLSKDRKYIWHPYTQHAKKEDPILVTKAQGALLYDDRGQEIIDAVSSWWVNIHGHGDPRIAKAVYDQFLKLEQVIFSGFTHEIAIELSERLLECLPKNLSKVFFSDNGSTSVEVAIKMALQYFYNKGDDDKIKIIAFEEGFHGETFGAMSVSGEHQFNKAFKNHLFEVARIPAPIKGNEAKSFEQLRKHLVKTHEHLQ